MICLSVAGLSSLFSYLGFSFGFIGIMAVVANLIDDYPAPSSPTFQQSKTKSD